MRLYTKVIKHIYPKYLLWYLICTSLWGLFLYYVTSVNTKYQHLSTGKYYFFLIATLGMFVCFFLYPKIIRIKFIEPNKGQKTTRLALLSFIWMTMTFPNLLLHDIIDHYFGKLVKINNLSEIPKAKDTTYFVLQEPIDLKEYDDYYFVNSYSTGRQQKSLKMDVYATKISNISKHKEGIIASIYKNDYGNLSYSKNLFNKSLRTADSSFNALQLMKGDTLKVIRATPSISLLLKSVALSNTYNNSNIFVTKVNGMVQNYRPSAFYLYFLATIIFNLIIILFLCTGKTFE